MSRSRMKVPYTMKLLLRQKKTLGAYKRAWQKLRIYLRKEVNEFGDLGSERGTLKKMTEILKAERRQR